MCVRHLNEFDKTSTTRGISASTFADVNPLLDADGNRFDFGRYRATQYGTDPTLSPYYYHPFTNTHLLHARPDGSIDKYNKGPPFASCSH